MSVRKRISAYNTGLIVPAGTPLDLAIRAELFAIKNNGHWLNRAKMPCGNGLAFHVKRLQQLLWPWKHWHRWNESLILPELCRPVWPKRIAIWGPSSTGKSHEAAAFALCLYLATPRGTTVMVSTRTRDELDIRIWGEIKKLWREAKDRADWLPGHLIESKQMLTTDGKEVEGREFRDGIMGVPCIKGGQFEGLGPMVGVKNDRIVLVADELSLMPGNFLDSIANLMSNEHCTSIGLGNLSETTNQLGKLAEPKLGWDALSDSMKSRGYDTRWSNGRAIQLVGEDSPNFDFPANAEPYKKLIGRRYVEQCKRDYGEGTPLYIMFAGGGVPRGTMARRVITRALCSKNKAFEAPVWGHEKPTWIYALDAAYSSIGGDRTAGAPFAFGRDHEGNPIFAMMERPRIFTGPVGDERHEEAIARQARAECERLEIEPHRFFFDGTGRSSLTSALAKLWSPNVVPIEFGGNATERPNFQGYRWSEGPKQGELKTCRDVFGKLVSELWFATTALIGAGQMRGMTEELVEEGEMRLWDVVQRGKVDVETKDKTRLRLQRSPDLYDMFVCGVEGARRMGFALGKIERRFSSRGSEWLARARTSLAKINAKQELIAT